MRGAFLFAYTCNKIFNSKRYPIWPQKNYSVNVKIYIYIYIVLFVGLYYKIYNGNSV